MELAKAALVKAKITLMARPDSTFFTTVCFSVKHKFDTSIPTACTNGLEIRFNPEFFMTLSKEEQVFLLIHETCHICYLHMDRLSTRDHAKWNVAADNVINNMLIERGFKMPKGGLADPQYKGMSTEEVYRLLPEQDPSKVDMDIQPGEGPPEDLTKELQDILIRAAMQSKMAGNTPGSIPGDVHIYLNGLLNPKLPWNRILQKYLHATAKSDYSFRKPNRRFFPKHHLPSLHSESLMNIAIAVDASGSVSDEDFKVFASETNGILRMMRPEKITLIQFDTEIIKVDEVRSVMDLSKVTFTGRGGTDIHPVLEWATVNKPQLLLVFTDGEFRFTDVKTKVPVLWVIHNSPQFTAPFGKVISYSI